MRLSDRMITIMSSAVPPDLYPIIVVQDRYQGGYSGGAWSAIAQADRPLAGTTRIAWLMDEGPGGGDVSASDFWRDPPSWIATGDTADRAIARLMLQNRVTGLSTADDDSKP